MPHLKGSLEFVPCRELLEVIPWRGPILGFSGGGSLEQVLWIMSPGGVPIQGSPRGVPSRNSSGRGCLEGVS